MPTDNPLTDDDLDRLGSEAFRAADPLAIAAQLADAAQHGGLADAADAGYAYLLAAEIYHREGESETALTTAERALATYDGADARERGWPRCFRAELLFHLGRDDEAMAELTDLRQLMTSDPLAPSYVAEALEEADRAETAVQWLTEALDELQRRHPEVPDELEEVVYYLLVTRHRLRGELELPHDGYDELADDLLAATEHDAGDDELEQPVLIWWPEQDHAAVGLRWPALLAEDGFESWQEHRRLRQVAIVAWGELGRPPLRQVTGSADGFAEFLAARGLDGDQDALTLYTEQLAEQGEAVVLPPGRNEPCWCGSGVKYKKCCLPRGRS